MDRFKLIFTPVIAFLLFSYEHVALSQNQQSPQAINITELKTLNKGINYTLVWYSLYNPLCTACLNHYLGIGTEKNTEKAKDYLLKIINSDYQNVLLLHEKASLSSQRLLVVIMIFGKFCLPVRNCF